MTPAVQLMISLLASKTFNGCFDNTPLSVYKKNVTISPQCIFYKNTHTHTHHAATSIGDDSYG